ncbi:GNAT family N-acetyltransferase [Liquorilactobacillus oeni]|uniref:Acetyltransferase n=1 Tax=Liquorilactobacillus oeni DSM 19972 TaxID=1423777 RepID=A0A0R1MDH2_9LACO|nr:GNAT family N-acetyltransferase [Liquorilactobacillus oeni]KRL06205.1 acetyltransferase [Liquorilactobacillus oeni DSM 19972]
MKESNLKIRQAVPEDAQALVKIYSYYVKETAITFEYTVPSVSEFKTRINKISTNYPYLVALLNNKIVGYAYLSAFHPRAAYHWSAEVSIYLENGLQHHGLGSLLYQLLEKSAYAQNILNLNACISFLENADEHLPLTSIYFHKKMGYLQTAHFHECGYKFSKWYDMIWAEKHISSHPIPAPVFYPFSKISNSFFQELNATGY